MATQSQNDWVQLNPYDGDDDEISCWRRDTQAALETMSSAGIVQWKQSGRGVAVRRRPASPADPSAGSSSGGSAGTQSASTVHVPEDTPDNTPDDAQTDALDKLKRYYTTRGWTIISGLPAYKGEGIVSLLNEASEGQSYGQALQDRRLDDDLDDDGDEPVLAVHRGVDTDTEFITFKPSDISDVRLALETMTSKLPIQWDETPTEPPPSSDGARFTVELEWPTDRTGQDEVEKQCRPEGYIALVGDGESEEKRTAVLRGMRFLMGGTGGLRVEYRLCEDVLGVIPPWVRERRNREYGETYGDEWRER